jgi:hypothetical protein
MNFGTLAAPTVSPAAGVYADAQLITLSALAGAAIRYTTDGSEPTMVSNVYVAPFQVTGNGAVKARAFHPDWTQSAVAVASYTIDGDPPSISASRFPSAIDGWHNTPTTISFVCEDNVGIASCSSSGAVSAEGMGQQITGTATDQAGRQATETVSVNLDLTPPVVAITAPAAPQTTSSASINLTGEVSDALSGLAGVTCNGEPATVVSGSVSCTVALAPGRNDITLAARDAAGNVDSKGVRITRIGTATVLGLTPNAKTLLAEETTTLTLTDEFGAVVSGATWSSSDPAIVAASSDDPPVFTALQAGTVTVTATKSGLTAQATLTVFAGSSLPYGTTRWSTSGGPGLTVSHTIAANRVDLSVPDLFSIEYVGTTEVVRGITAGGDVLWTQQSPGTPLMGDSFGGLVAGTLSPSRPYSHFPFSAFTRFGGPAEALPWRYNATGELARPAQAPDGTIYALERRVIGIQSNNVPLSDTKLIVLDGSTGTVRARLPIAPSRKGLTCGVNGTWEEPAKVWGPIVGNDGYGYLLVSTSKHLRSGPCPHAYSQDRSLAVWRVAPTGVMTSTTLFSQHCEKPAGVLTTCDAGEGVYGHGVVGDPENLLPDGIGGVLVRWQRVTSVSGDPSNPFTIETRLSRVVNAIVELDTIVDASERTKLIGGDGAAYVSSSTGPRAMNVSTWTELWSSSNLALEPVAPLREGRVAMHDVVAGTLTEFTGQGVPIQSVAFTGGVMTAIGIVTQVETAGSIANLNAEVTLALDEHINAFKEGGGSMSYQNAPQIAPGRTTDSDETAIQLMRHLLVVAPQADQAGVPYEHAGHICREPDGQHYYFHYLRRGTTTAAPGLLLSQEQCTNGATVGYAHSHPGHFADWEYPSGYRSNAAYLDVDLNPGNGDPSRSDLWIADSYFDDPSQSFVGPNGPNVMWYVTSPKQGQTFVKYKKTIAGPAKDNIRQFDYATRLWGMVKPVW